MNKLYSLTIILLLLSCNDDNIIDCTNSGEISVTQSDSFFKEYKKNINLWNCLDIQHYEMVYQNRSSFCGIGEVYIKIKNNIIIDSLIAGVEGVDYFICQFYTIPELFSFIEMAVDSTLPIERIDFIDNTPRVADLIDIEYDSQYGFPSRAFLNYLLTWADEEYQFSISDFRVLDN